MARPDPFAGGSAPRPGPAARCGCRGGAFTLIEMIVVIAIIVILVGLTLPAVNSMWEERKFAGAVTSMQGMLMTARSRGLSPDSAESGLFFYVDEGGTQQIVPIERDSEHSGDVAWENVFRLTGGRAYSLAKPIRLVPRYVIEESGLPAEVYTGEELANDDFLRPPDQANQAQRHRNFFTMVFGTDGQLLIRRDVLLQDLDEDEDNRGDITGLPVGYDHAGDKPIVNKYYQADDVVVDMHDDANGIPTAVSFLVHDPEQNAVALNFPSVDGLLVYDDSLFVGLRNATVQREYLLESAQPFYVNRYTGAVVQGPLGEN